MNLKKTVPVVLSAVISLAVQNFNIILPGRAEAAYHFANFQGRPPVHVYKSAQRTPSGVTPAMMQAIYHLPKSGGTGTIAIIDAYEDPTIESDLNTFSEAYGLPSCTTKGQCFEKHKMTTSTVANSDWALETSLDVEWAHAIAPSAKILLIEAKTPSGTNLLQAVDYAAAREDVVAISMSWGGAEFPEERSLDSHFLSASGAAFFAASGDSGSGASWPAASSRVIGVGGTSLELSSKGGLIAESGWSGSGGGISAYEPEPNYQKAYDIPRAKGMRAIPDVAYAAYPQFGYPVYKSSTAKKGGWYTVGGTSAGAPQWAAIEALGRSVSLNKLYSDKASTETLKFFRDITNGSNGTCSYYCDARKRYDYVTGLGTPQTVAF